MGRLFYFEIKKLGGNRLFVCFFVLFILAALLVPMAQIFLPDRNGGSRKELSVKYREYTEMPIETALETIRERVQALEREEHAVPDADNPRGELTQLGEVQEYIQRIADYGTYRESVLARQDQLMPPVFGREDSYAARLAEYTAEAYGKTGKIDVKPAEPQGVLLALGDGIDVSLFCGFSMLLCVFLFLPDKGNGLERIILTAKYGRKASRGVKLVVAILGSCLFCLFLLCSRLCWSAACIGLGDVGRPIQSIPGYYASAWRISVWQGLVLNAAVRTYATVLMTLVFSLFCIVWDGAAAWCGMAASLAVSYAASGLVAESSAFQPFRYLNLVSVFRTELYGGTVLFLKFGERPIPWIVAAVLSGTFLGALCLTVGMTKKPDLERKRRWSVFGAVRRRVSVRRTVPFILELKKLLVPQYGYIVLLLVLLLQPAFWNSFYSRIGTTERLYEAGMKQVQGIYSDEKDTQIQAQYQEMLEDQASYQSVQMDGMARLAGLSSYLRERNGTAGVHYLYESGYEMLLGMRPAGYRYQSYLIAISLVLLLGGIFSVEAESGMEVLCQSTQGLDAMQNRKCCTALFVTIWIVLINWLPEMIFAVCSFPVSFREALAPAVSVQSLAAAPGWLSLAGAIVCVAFVRLLGAVLVMLVVLTCSKRSRSYLASVIKCIVVLMLELLLYVVLPSRWKMLSLFGLLAGEGICDFGVVNTVAVLGWAVAGVILYRQSVRQSI